MKINYLLLLSVFIFFASSCSKDNGGELIPSPESNPAEDLILDVNMVSDNFIIESASRVQGSLPAANGNLNAEVPTEEQSAFLKNGFNIEFNASSAVTGAYIRIQDPDGNGADSYFDVPSYGFGAGFNGNPDKEVKLFNPKNGDEDNVIDVNFDNDMSPGTFCYTICFYDDEGNISTPQEVCVEVESWGGFSALVGSWKFDSYTSDLGDVVGGEEVCVTSGEDFPCANGESLKADEVCQSTAIDLIMEEGGDFRLSSEQIFKYLDFEESYETCTAKYEEPTEWDSYFEGKWAYDEEENRMTLVYFNGVSLGIDLDAEEGELGYEGITTVSGNSMTVNLEVPNPLSDETFIHVYTFSK